EDVDTVGFDNIPEPVRFREVWSPLVHDGGSPVREWAIDHVRMSGNPSDVGRAPESIILMEIEYPAGRQRDLCQVPPCRVNDPFRFAGCSACVKDEKRML